MNFSERFIRRPVLSIVVSLLIFLLGAQGFFNMSVRQYPAVQESQINIQTTYPGASAETMEGFITAPIAKAVSSTEHVDYVSSSSSLGSSEVQVHMLLGSDADKALTEVMTKVQQVKRQLPSDADDPIITKTTGRNIALIFAGFSSDQMNSAQITEYLTRVVQPRFATVPGVADAQVFGAQNFSMRIWLDPVRMASRGVTAGDIEMAVRNANFIAAPGTTENKYVLTAIDATTTLKTPEAFGALPIRGSGNNIVRLRDVARVELGPVDHDVSVSFNGHRGVIIAIQTTPSANPLDVANGVKALMPDIRKQLPPGMSSFIVFDNSVFISASIAEVFKTIFEAIAIVIVVIFLFLGSGRAVIIPILTIPLSLVGVCFILYAVGFSINLLTLLAMVLAIGLVVDDAIVVVENVHRHIEHGEKPLDAAIAGMRELTSAVIAMTITLAAVFTPIAFMGGLTGALFREFAVALAGAVLISGLIALTLSPMMAGRILKSDESSSKGFAGWLDRRFESVQNGYVRLLDKSLNSRSVIVAMVAVLLATAGFLFMHTPSELAPPEDQGAVLSQLQGPRYANTAYMRKYVDEFSNLVGNLPEAKTHFTISGANGDNTALAIWTLKPWDQRKRSAQQLQQILQMKLGQLPGAQGFVFSPPLMPGTQNSNSIDYVVRSLGTPQEVYKVAEDVKAKALASGKFQVVQNSLAFDVPRANVKIDRERAAALNTSVADIGTTLSVLLSNGRISRYDQDNRNYDVIAQVEDKDRINPDNLNNYYVRSGSGDMVPLSAVATVTTSAGPVDIEQFNQLNSATLQANLKPGVSEADAMATMKRIGAEVMPAGFFDDFAGSARVAMHEGNTLATAFGLAVLVIYLVLAAQFESFRDPLIIMMAVPCSIFGALVLLNIGSGPPLSWGFASLNIYTKVGLITLVGLITKHGILMVQFANERRAGGVSRREAIEEAARVRLRPILMTTAAMVMGVMPLVFSSGAGAAARAAIGVVIASGVAIGTLFTLFVVPTFYTLISKADRRAEAPGAVREEDKRGHVAASGRAAE